MIMPVIIMAQTFAQKTSSFNRNSFLFKKNDIIFEFSLFFTFCKTLQSRRSSEPVFELWMKLRVNGERCVPGIYRTLSLGSVDANIITVTATENALGVDGLSEQSPATFIVSAQSAPKVVKSSRILNEKVL